MLFKIIRKDVMCEIFELTLYCRLLTVDVVGSRVILACPRFGRSVADMQMRRTRNGVLKLPKLKSKSPTMCPSGVYVQKV